tara:strand:+ start:1692 stop:3437 length:1746 start_codon:yes stop_codon:yes gene_type:complete
VFQSKSLLKNNWILQNVDERLILSLSQKKNISYLLSKLLILRGITLDSVEDYLQSNILDNYPNPFNLIDMEKAINRVIEGIKNNQKFGIIADYDVDGSTSAAILYKFLSNFTKNISLKIPNRLTEGYGPNIRIMDEMLNDNIKIVFTLDCGTTAFNIIDNIKYNEIDVIVIDHHLSETKLPKVHSIINPNRVDENNNFNQMAAVGVTFLFLMGLRKKLRNFNLTMSKTEPNLMSYLDLVALGTICDVVKLTDYNRRFVKKGLELIKQRHNKSISKIIDNSKINSAPSASDLGYIIGPQLNAASRIDDSSLPSKFLISNDINQIESISRKLFLLNEKRKLIENKIFEESLQDAEKQKKSKYILVYGKNWHNGVLGIVASRLISYFNKPVIVVSFINNFGIGSARSIDNIDLGQIILNAKHQKILIGGGGHSMAAGIKIKYEKLNNFISFLNQSLDNYDSSLFDKNSYYDSIISVNELNNNLLKTLQKMEPYGSGNAEPNFIIKDLIIESVKIIKEKHLLLFFENNHGEMLKGICFNCINNPLGEYLLNFKKYKFNFGCSITVDNYSNQIQPQIIVKDVMITD